MSNYFNRGNCERCLLPSPFPTGHSDPFACIAALKKELALFSPAYAAHMTAIVKAIKETGRIVFETKDGGTV